MRALAGDLWIDNDPVFSDLFGGPIDPRIDYERWLEILASLGISAATVHDMRHTAATLFIAQGVDVVTVPEILGHSDIRTTRVTSLRRRSLRGLRPIVWVMTCGHYTLCYTLTRENAPGIVECRGRFRSVSR